DRFFRIDFEGRILEFKAGSELDERTSAKNMIGKSLEEVLSEKAAARIHEAIARVRQTKAIVTMEYAAEDRGSPAFFEARFLPLSANQIIVLVRNISERKNMQAQLVFADRMASVGTVAAGVAHEVNNPLTYVLSNINFAMKAVEDLIGGGGPPGLKAV